MEKLLEVNNLKVSYHTYAGEVQSVRGISFHLDKAETYSYSWRVRLRENSYFKGYLKINSNSARGNQKGIRD
ncbi:hypothetical protein M918_09905 [Clostridium sp. BL8]|nr:hypothetical protein M918_09905 [Clostridium sp. BL8]